MRIQFSSTVVRGHIYLVLVDETDDLDVVGRAHELQALDGACGDNASSAAGLGAPCYLLALGVGDERVWLGRSPKTPV